MEPLERAAADFLDPPAFRDFYDDAFPVVFGYFVTRLSGRRDLAAELTQETFLSAVRTVRSTGPPTAPLPWIVTIARRRLIDHFRRPLPPTPADDLGVTVNVGSMWTSAEEEALASSLSSLSPLHRLTLILRYVDDLPVNEVADALGKSTRATESLLVRARAALSTAYQEHAHG